MIISLRRKFIAIAMGSVAAVLILIIGGMNLLNYVNMLSSTDTRLDILVENRGRFPLNQSHPRDDQFKLEKKDFYGRRDLSVEAPFDTRFFTVVLNADGLTLSIDTGKIAAVSTSEASSYAQELYSDGKTAGFFDNYRYLAVSTKDFDNNDNIMYIFLDCERELSSFKSSLLSSIGVSVLGMLLVFALVVFFSKKIFRPVAESYDKQKRFITDASHELKTPLTVIDANTEVIEMMWGENEWTQSIHNQIKRLSTLTQKLVFLTRMDEGNRDSFDMLDFSLSDAVEDTAQPFKAVAATNKKTLELNITPALNMFGDEAAIRQLVSILLDNAIKYSPENGEILLTLKQNGRNNILTVYNTADNVPAGKLDILFERFYRTDASRNSSTGGFGIGLSVAKAIVLAHRGKISAKSEDGKSIIFTIVL